MNGKRLNIGLLIDDFDHYFSSQACKGAELAAKALDANLFIFPGHYIGKPDSSYSDREYEYQYNTVFNLPSSRNVDIIYAVLGTICSRADLELQMKFIDSFPDVPVVCLFSSFEGLPSVTFDNKSGFENAIDHLIEKHGARNIGFVSGPLTNRDARERLEVFTNVMKKHDITVEKNNVVYGDFSVNCGDEVRKLIERNGKLDAIVFANDSMAKGGYEVLADLGLKIGKDILVTGFDDDEFAINLDPPLTTVEASSAELTYKAVLNAANYINGSALTDMSVETRLINRNSCGCNRLDNEEMRIFLKTDRLESGERVFIGEMKKYLFGIFAEDRPVVDMKEKLSSFFNAYADYLESPDSAVDELDSVFTSVLKTPILTYSTPEKLFNVLQVMQFESEKIVKDEDRLAVIRELFSDFYRRISFAEISITSQSLVKNERLLRVVNQQTGDIFLLSNDADIPYERLLDGLYSAGFDRSLLYLFQSEITNEPGKEWKCPNSFLLKAISDKNGVRALSEEQQLIRRELMFSNEFIEDDERRTMVVSPLFVGQDIYGFIVNELDTRNLVNIAPVAIQLSVSLKSILMIEGHNKVRRSLQNSIERFIRDNTQLDAIAKQDELTGLYNRRGFIASVEKLISDPDNYEKVAILCYADMDNLKMVNDKFGHDDGDFALRTVSNVLRESFRESDIIGRFGGDEFVVLAITGIDCDVSGIKDRIERVTKRHNDKAGKPYPIAMSTGIYKFKCSPDVDIYEILDNADRLLYEEKQRKKKQFGSYR